MVSLKAQHVVRQLVTLFYTWRGESSKRGPRKLNACLGTHTMSCFQFSSSTDLSRITPFMAPHGTSRELGGD